MRSPPIELTEAEKAMTMEEYEDQEERLPRPPDIRDPDGYYRCGECKEPIGGQHKPTCKVHNQFRKWYRKMLHESEKANNTPRPDWMCQGCDQPKEGPHRFGCSIHGARAGQLVLPASQDENGKFTVHVPGSPESIEQKKE